MNDKTHTSAVNLCGECHGRKEVVAKCACGCGREELVTCPHCRGSGLEHYRKPSWSWTSMRDGTNWLRSKIGSIR